MTETATLLGLAEIVETTRIDTAAITGAARARLLVNPEFVAQHASTPGRLFMLLMHELHHVMLGHTRRVLHTAADNFVFDAVINAMISRRFPEPQHTVFLTGFYPWQFPYFLLRPPPGWRPGTRGAAIRTGLARTAVTRLRLFSRLSLIYRALYHGPGATYDEVAAALGDRDVGEIQLLGSHGAECPMRADDAVRELAEAVAAEAPPAGQGFGGRLPGPGRDLTEFVSAPARTPGNRARLRRLLERVAGAPTRGSLFPETIRENQGILTPLPRNDRRSVVLGALGADPLLRVDRLAVLSEVRAGLRVHVYLDVSGSMDGLIEPLYRAVLDCREFVHPRVHLFSTEVADVTLGDMRAGRIRTTGGTHISCVAAHMRRRRVRRACIITDGWVGVPEGQDFETLRDATVGAAFPAERHNSGALDQVLNHHTVLRAAHRP